MTHYSENPGMVRFDRFKASGKWYDTYELNMYGSYSVGPTPYEAIREAFANSERFGTQWVENWLAQGHFIVCLEPYHESSHPICLKNS